MRKSTIEQQCRDLLERMGVQHAQSYSAGDLVELSELVSDALIVARFVSGYWPGLEDGIDAWGDEDALNRDPRLLAAHRLLQRFPKGGGA